MAKSIGIAGAFDVFSNARLNGVVLEEIWSNAFGENYAKIARPNGFYSEPVLDQIIASARGSTSTRRLLDIGCGYGLTGLYLAEQMKMELCGIDVSEASIGLAQKNAEDRGSNAQFWVSDVTSIKLEDKSCAVVTCLDVLLYIPDKLAALKEIYRVLEQGGHFAFTTWEQPGFNERLSAQQLEDYRPLLLEAGFEIEFYDAVDGASEQQSRVLEGLLERQEELRKDIGSEAALMFAKMAKSAGEELKERRYVLGIAKRTTQ